jgi:hypothetical protein
MADVLHHSSNLKEWFSLYPEDKVFGAKHDFFKQDLTGKNTYVNPPFNTFENKQNLIEKVIKKVSDSLRSNLPTKEWFYLSPFLMEKWAISMRLRQENRAFWK